MSRYVFTFFKRMADSTGHEVETPEDAIELSSATLRDAVETATRRFADKRHIRDWSLHADRIAILVRG
jgi:hypothetical protein